MLIGGKREDQEYSHLSSILLLPNRPHRAFKTTLSVHPAWRSQVGDRHLVAGGERVSKKGQGPRSPSFGWEGRGEGKYTATMVPVSPGGHVLAAVEIPYMKPPRLHPAARLSSPLLRFL